MQQLHLTLAVLLNFSSLALSIDTAWSCRDAPADCKYGIAGSTWVGHNDLHQDFHGRLKVKWITTIAIFASPSPSFILMWWRERLLYQQGEIARGTYFVSVYLNKPFAESAILYQNSSNNENIPSRPRSPPQFLYPQRESQMSRPTTSMRIRIRRLDMGTGTPFSELLMLGLCSPPTITALTCGHLLSTSLPHRAHLLYPCQIHSI
ncbi:hypothetical protein E2P81_ATG06760 [Venturia nashicola]|uniref:Uncharacterized protein n=1 Tax=Venturia nashicola TaxID=86259 RepID=A0A4Z1NUM7_9PEZI|nr:hypothetical protein E6O75_ATG06932 [Venturia nashicola]TLD30107.1 hypothetical protein E2P81_ATG06760 [Venturia nashicola]